MAIDVVAVKQTQRKMWSTGGFPEIAKIIQSSADLVVKRADISAADDVLDVATGSGNAAIPAAQAGANVTGLDLTPELFEAARTRAAEAQVTVDWIEGDAEALPFDDDSFDRVTSVFGCMFAPQHQVAANEIARVCRPGGKFVIAAWTPDGMNGRMFKTVGQHMPPPPPEFIPPVAWGNEDHVRSLFAESGATLEFETAAVEFADESIEHWLDYSERMLGPMVLAKAQLEPEGKWQAARDDLARLYDEFNEADDGTLRAPANYLVTIGQMPE